MHAPLSTFIRKPDTVDSEAAIAMLRQRRCSARSERMRRRTACAECALLVSEHADGLRRDGRASSSAGRSLRIVPLNSTIAIPGPLSRSAIVAVMARTIDEAVRCISRRRSISIRTLRQRHGFGGWALAFDGRSDEAKPRNQAIEDEPVRSFGPASAVRRHCGRALSQRAAMTKPAAADSARPSNPVTWNPPRPASCCAASTGASRAHRRSGSRNAGPPAAARRIFRLLGSSSRCRTRPSR